MKYYIACVGQDNQFPNFLSLLYPAPDSRSRCNDATCNWHARQSTAINMMVALATWVAWAACRRSTTPTGAWTLTDPPCTRCSTPSASTTSSPQATVTTTSPSCLKTFRLVSVADRVCVWRAVRRENKALHVRKFWIFHRKDFSQNRISLLGDINNI